MKVSGLVPDLTLTYAPVACATAIPAVLNPVVAPEPTCNLLPGPVVPMPTLPSPLTVKALLAYPLP